MLVFVVRGRPRSCEGGSDSYVLVFTMRLGIAFEFIRPSAFSS